LKVSGRRLDGNSPPFETSGYASNGYREQDWKSFTVIGIDIPTPGCWEITGQYKEQELSYVVWVTAAQPAVAASTANAKAPSVPAVAADVPPPNMSVELHDTTSGVSWKAPPGWHFAPIQRWGDHQSTVRIMGAEWPKIRPTLYYRIFENPQEMSPRVISRQLLRQINGKVRQRKEDGFQNYRVREGSAEQLLVNGNSAVRWVADYAESGDDMSEYLVRVRTDHTNALFYAFMPAKELDSFRQRFDPIIETLEIP
jgi:hypothetical protein